MQSVTETCKHSKWVALVLAISCSLVASAQINSPYSRIGMGDIYNSRNAVTRGMGGLGVAYTDYQSVNFHNAASYSNLQTVTFDVGLEAEFRNLLNQDKSQRKQSGNLIFNYVALGMPLVKDKKGFTKWGLAMGLRPMTRVQYSIFEDERLPGIDSARSFYEGDGGGYQAFLGTGFRVGALTVGINGGFLFGQQDIRSRRTWVNDSVYYFNSSSETKTSYKKVTLDAGLQYRQKLAKDLYLRIGASAFLGGDMKARQDFLRQTFVVSAASGVDSIDVVYRENDVPGTITLPMGYNAGLTMEKENRWLVGVEYNRANWSDFSFVGQQENVANSYMLRFGANWTPSITDVKSYFRRVNYRAGFYTGKDYVVVNDQQLPVWGLTFGLGLPVRRWNVYSNQYTNLNLGFEYGSRGNNQSVLKENIFRVSLGFALSDIWFIKRRYN